MQTAESEGGTALLHDGSCIGPVKPRSSYSHPRKMEVWTANAGTSLPEAFHPDQSL